MEGGGNTHHIIATFPTSQQMGGGHLLMCVGVNFLQNAEFLSMYKLAGGALSPR